jgi:hypothetical protein
LLITIDGAGIYNQDLGTKSLQNLPLNAWSTLTFDVAWCRDNAPRFAPKSPMAKAIAYIINQWETLVVFLKDPRLRLDNNISERLWSGLTVKHKDPPYGKFARLPLFEVWCSVPMSPSASWLQSTIRGVPQEGFRRRVASLLHSVTRARGSSFRTRFPPDSRHLRSLIRSKAVLG